MVRSGFELTIICVTDDSFTAMRHGIFSDVDNSKLKNIIFHEDFWHTNRHKKCKIDLDETYSNHINRKVDLKLSIEYLNGKFRYPF